VAPSFVPFSSESADRWPTSCSDQAACHSALHTAARRLRPRSLRDPGLQPLLVSRRVKRLALTVLALLITAPCCACLAPTGGNADYNPPPGEYRPPSSAPPSSVPPSSAPPSSVPTETGRSEQEALAFGESYTWDDGVRATVGKPKKFKPSRFAVVEKERRYVRFTVTVVNKSDKPLDLSLTYVTFNHVTKRHTISSTL